jgi:hypothetical protein
MYKKQQTTGAIHSQLNLSHTLVPYFFKIHFNIILSSTPRSLSVFPQSFTTTTLYKFLLCSNRVAFPAHLISILSF